MTRRFYKAVNALLLTCMILTDSSIIAFAEGKGRDLDEIVAVRTEYESISDNDIEPIDIAVSENDIITAIEMKETPGPMYAYSSNGTVIVSVDEAMEWCSKLANNRTSVGYNDGSGEYQCCEFTQGYMEYITTRTYSNTSAVFAASAYSNPERVPSYMTMIQGAIPQKGDILIYYHSNVANCHVAVYCDENTTYHQNYAKQYYVTRQGNYLSGLSEGQSYWGVWRPKFSEVSTPSSNTFSFNVIGTSGRGSVSDTNATLYAKLATNVRSGLQVGIQIGRSSGNYDMVNHTENLSSAGYDQLNSSGEVEIWFECNNELGVTLSSGTKYYYRFIVTYNGQTYYSAENTFTTTGISTNHDPQGDVNNIEGGMGTIHVRGWAFDEDTPTSPINVHVYIGDSAYPGSQAEVHELTANVVREDVGKAYPGIGNYHGFDATIITNRRGTQPVYIYAINNVKDTNNPWIGEGTVTIQSDTEVPTITSAQITSYDKDGYTVTATVSDNVGVTSVKFPSWVLNATDAIWYDGTLTSDGKYICKINTTDFQNREGNYITDVYAYDAAGNSSKYYRLSATIDRTAPSITNAYAERVSDETVKVSCTVSDSSGISTVAFPTWTTYNEQDDLTSNWWINCAGEKNGNTWSFYVNDYDHNYEKGTYVTDIYAKDTYGNVAQSKTVWYSIENRFEPTVFTYNGHKYEIYDDLLTWTEAKEKCEQLGGHLVSITSQEEQAIITEHIQSSCRNYFYIGAEIGCDTWITGEQIEYTNWGPGQPSNSYGVEDIYEVCKENGMWNDSCRTTLHGRGFICEYESSIDMGDVLPDDVPDGGIPEGMWISQIDEEKCIYDGSEIRPEIRVYNENKLLECNTDYTITYKNNNKAGQATAIVVGKGNYQGTIVLHFAIPAQNIDVEDIIISPIISKYNTRTQKKIPAVTWNGKKLRNNVDYTVEYPDLESNENAYKEPGTYNILIRGTGNYTGEKLTTITITENELISKAYVSKIADQPYTGNAIEPVLSVRHGMNVLEPGRDYTAEYKDNVETGTASVVLTGIGNYSGTKTVTFKITGTSIASAMVSDMPSSFVYSGSAITTDSDIWEEDPVLTIKTGNEEKVLVKGTDYDISYRSNTDKGTAVVQFTGTGAYTGKLTRTFRIQAYDIAKDVSEQMALYLETDNYEYEKGGNRPRPVVMFGNTILTEKKDYTLSYRNNYKVNDGSDASKAPAVIVKGKGNFSGSKELTFTITGNDLSDLIMSAEDKVFLDRESVHESEPVIMTQSGQKLKKGQDYEETLTYCYKEETTLENGTVREAGALVEKDDVVPEGTTLEVIAVGKGNYEGLIKSEYRVVKYDISRASVTIPKKDYTGEAVTLDKSEITVKLGDVVLDADDYEIVSYQDNTDRGRAKVTIRGTGEYGGIRTVRFTIKSKLLEWWEGILNMLFG